MGRLRRKVLFGCTLQVGVGPEGTSVCVDLKTVHLSRSGLAHRRSFYFRANGEHYGRAWGIRRWLRWIIMELGYWLVVIVKKVFSGS